MEEKIDIKTVEEAIKFIDKEIERLEPTVEYTLETKYESEFSIVYIYHLHNKEFVQSFYFTKWMLEIQQLLWPNKIFNIWFIYSEKK